MGFFDTFKGKQFKTELEALQKEYENIQALMTPEMQEANNLQKAIENLHVQCDNATSELGRLNIEVADRQKQISDLDFKIEELKKQIVSLDDEIVVQEFGLYTPRFDFASALDYKEALASVRAQEKALIKDSLAVSGATNWSVNGDAKKGKKMVTDTQKLLLRAFNNECDDLVSKVKYTNFDASLERIYKSSEAISKLGSVMNISVTQPYVDLKVKELRLAFEYQLKKQEEKEAQQAARAEQREQAKLEKELAAELKKIEKEQTHYQTAYEKLQQQLSLNPNDPDLLNKKAELESRLDEIEKSISDIDYRQANMKAGYVYVISNIGSFGPDVYKIGMTRRLDPQDRVDELGDASVPFNFDVHAMIFSDDAPALEAALHRAFSDKKLNMVNQRREFFHVTLDEIKTVIKENFDKTVDFIDVPDAEQFRVSEKIRESKQ